MDKNAVIIGGGVSGLTVAYHLSRRGISGVAVLEAGDRFGGVIRTLRDDRFHMEAGADAFDGREPAVLDLCEPLGLRNELLECRPTLCDLFLLTKKKILRVDLSDPAGIFRSRVPGFRARARLLFEAMIPARAGDSDESIAEFIHRRFGRDFLEDMVQPFVGGVLMAGAGGLSLGEYFPQWRDLEREHGSIIRSVIRGKKPAGKTGMFFTVRGGLDRLVPALTQGLSGTNLELRSEAVSVRHEEGWKIFLRNGRVIRASAVCLAIPAYAAAGLLWDFAPSLAGELGKIRYDPVVTVNLAYPVGAFPEKFPEEGFLVPGRGEPWPFACLKSVGLTEGREFFKLRAFISGERQPGTFSQDPEKIKREVLDWLERRLGVRTPPVRIWVERYPKALVQYAPGHRRLVSNIENMLRHYPGLFIAGNGYYGFGISDCVREGDRAARGLASYLETGV